MRARILSTVALDDARLAGEIARIDGLAARDDYSEYSFGSWRSHVLANGTGEVDDATFRRYDGPMRPTALGEALPYLRQVIEDTFHTDALRWVRLFTVQNGLLISHRDFVEFDRGFVRLHLPLRTDTGCLHSEEDEVYHMRRGEVWFLDADTVHSACSLSSLKRISLVLDFEAAGTPPEALVRARGEALPAPHRVERPPLEPGFLEALYGLAGMLAPVNFRDVMGVLAKVHFYRQAGAAECFDWLMEIARRSGDEGMLRRAADFRRFSIERRVVGERFTF